MPRPRISAARRAKACRQQPRGHREVLVVLDGQGEAEPFEFSGLYRADGPRSRVGERVEFGYNSPTAKVAELADALDLGSSAERHVGSSPSFRTTWGQAPVLSLFGLRGLTPVFRRIKGAAPVFTQQGKPDAASRAEHS